MSASVDIVRSNARCHWTRAPRDGWLILAGRRGHYAFCDEVRAYSLDTGAAYIAQSCSGLALRSDGSVDAGQTNAQREESIRGGRILADNLREAVWMLILKSHAYDTRVSADSYPIPHGMTVRYHAGGLEESATLFGAGPGWSTAWTTLDWHWIRANGEVVAHGDVTWPTSTEPAEAHAAALLDIAEKSLVSGCPPSPLPVPAIDAILAKKDQGDEAVKVMQKPARVRRALCGQ